MKIKIGDKPENTVIVDASSYIVTLIDVFCGIGIETDQGRFGIAQRDDGIEVLLDGKLVWSSMDIDVKCKDHTGEYVCLRCNDTHLVKIHEDGQVDRESMCMHCPIPCDECMGGGPANAYCKETPCNCECHKVK